MQGVTSVVVGLSTGRLTPGRVVARDFLLDLALVRITAPDLVPAEFTRKAAVEIGETVIAIGNPLALKGGSTVTVGVISASDRSVLTPEGETLYDLLQTDAAINPGNSGGPLVDRYGHVIGINVAIAPSAQAISYAIAMEAILPHIQSMIVRGVGVASGPGVDSSDRHAQCRGKFRPRKRSRDSGSSGGPGESSRPGWITIRRRGHGDRQPSHLQHRGLLACHTKRW